MFSKIVVATINSTFLIFPINMIALAHIETKLKLMHIKYTALLLYLLIVAPTTGVAQDALMLKDTIVAPDLYENFPRYRLSQTGISINTLRDEALSPLRYQGIGLVGIIQYWKYKGDQRPASRRPAFRRLVQNTLNFNASSYTNAVNDNVIASFVFSYQHASLYPIGLQQKSMRLYVGGLVKPLLNIKTLPTNVNNAISYELITSLGASGLFQYTFELFHKPFILSEQLSFPLLSLGLRPQYAWPSPTAVEEEGSLISDLQLGSWNRYFGITNQISLNFYTNKKIKRRVVKKVSHQLSYAWNFYAMRHPVLLQNASHTITYSRVLKID